MLPCTTAASDKDDMGSGALSACFQFIFTVSGDVSFGESHSFRTLNVSA